MPSCRHHGISQLAWPRVWRAACQPINKQVRRHLTQHSRRVCAVVIGQCAVSGHDHCTAVVIGNNQSISQQVLGNMQFAYICTFYGTRGPSGPLRCTIVISTVLNDCSDCCVVVVAPLSMTVLTVLSIMLHCLSSHVATLHTCKC